MSHIHTHDFQEWLRREVFKEKPPATARNDGSDDGIPARTYEQYQRDERARMESAQRSIELAKEERRQLAEEARAKRIQAARERKKKPRIGPRSRSIWFEGCDKPFPSITVAAREIGIGASAIHEAIRAGKSNVKGRAFALVGSAQRGGMP